MCADIKISWSTSVEGFDLLALFCSHVPDGPHGEPLRSSIVIHLHRYVSSVRMCICTKLFQFNSINTWDPTYILTKNMFGEQEWSFFPHQ